MLVINLDYDEFKGRIAFGRVCVGIMIKVINVKIGVLDKDVCNGKVIEVFIYNNFVCLLVDFVGVGDICVIVGFSDVMIGEIIMVEGFKLFLMIIVEEFIVCMFMFVNMFLFVG